MKRRILAILVAVLFILPNVPVIATVQAAGMDPEYATPKHGIPVMYVNIDESKGTIAAMNSSADHSAECHGSVDIKSPAEYKSEYTGAEFPDVSGLKLEYIRGRGNSTWGNPKKPYKLKFDKSVDLFGMGKNKHWVLLANYDDPTFLRNRVTYWLADQIGMEYTCKSVPVELVMNGKYYGLYYLCEQVRIGSSRIDIDELTKDDNDDASVTGGYLFAVDLATSYNEDAVKYSTTREMVFDFENPDFKEYKNDKQFNYIRQYLQDTENALFSPSYVNSKGKNYKDYLDLKSSADYYMFILFSNNTDGLSTPSTYMYKKRNGKLYWGPLWDFDSVTYGNSDGRRDDTGGIDASSVINYNIWMERIKKAPEFESLIKDRWKLLYSKISEATKDGGQIDKFYNEIKTAQTYDKALWGSDCSIGSFDDDIYHLKNWMKKRAEWINSNQYSLTNECEYIGRSKWINNGVWLDGKWRDVLDSYNETGSWGSDVKGYWFEDTSGWYAKNQWQMIDFTWYYFNESGYMVSNEWRDGRWLDSDGKDEYYLRGKWNSDASGYWFGDDSGWYAKSEWQKIDGKWYYFTDSGYMDYGEYRDGCWIGEDGAMVDGYTGGTWHSDANGWWFEDNGWYPTNQYLWIDGVQYWFGADGYMG